MKEQVMYGRTQALRYTEVAIKTANPIQLVVMLYEGAIQSLREAQGALLANDIPKRARAINRAVAMISELQASLDFEKGGEIANSLDRLYTYMNAQVFKGNVERDGKYFAEVVSLLENLNSAWTELARQAEASRNPVPASLPNVELAAAAGLGTRYEPLNISG
jgi:flagellar protein FliS